jgi:NADPH:quinone reductase
MQAMVFKQYGGPEQFVLTEIPTPVPKNGEVLIKVKALGINRAEVYMRKGLFGEVTPVSGIECVGQVENDPTGVLQPGQTVATITGGMGRTRNGSYAEYTCVPLQNVFSLETNLDWATLAAIPETYATARSCLFANLRITAGQVLFVRGGTSALGQAAINIAKREGVTVLTSTRNESKVALLTRLGATSVLIENGNLSEMVRTYSPEGIDGVLDLIGNSTLLDSLHMAKKGGRVCVAGFLGNMEPISYNWLADMPFGVDLNAFASPLFGTKDFPHSDIPMQKIVDRVADGTYEARPVKIFPFEHIPDAHRLMESNDANGKIVVVH